MRTVLIFIFLNLFIYSFSQQELILIDREDNIAIDLAHVYLLGEQTGRISNLNGMVQFLRMRKDDSLLVRHLQYQDTVIACSELQPGRDTIWLTPAQILLRAVDIYERDDFYIVKRILDSVNKYMPENYEMQSFYANGYVLDQRFYDNDLVSNTEVKLLWYKRGYDQDNTHGQAMNFLRRLLYRGKNNSNLFDIQRARVSINKDTYEMVKATPFYNFGYHFYNSNPLKDPMENFKRTRGTLSRNRTKDRYDYSLEILERGSKLYYLINIHANTSYLQETTFAFNYRLIIEKENYRVVEYAEYQPEELVFCLSDPLPVDYESLCMFNTKHQFIYETVNGKTVLKIVYYSYESYHERDPSRNIFRHQAIYYLDDITDYNVKPLHGVSNDYNTEKLHQKYKANYWEEGFPIELYKDLKDSIFSY